MLDPFHDKIEQLAFVYAHCGLNADEDNRIYSVAATIMDMDKPRKKFESLVRYSMLTGRERYYSNISKEMLHKAPHHREVSADLRNFLKGQKIIFAFDDHDNSEDLRKFCGDVRIVDLSFAGEFFLPYSESCTPRRLWEHLTGKQRDKISFSAAEILDLSIALTDEICSVKLSDKTNPPAPALRYYLKKSDTLFGEAFIHIAQNYKRYFGGLFDPCTERDTRSWKKFLERVTKSRRKKKKKKRLIKKYPRRILRSCTRAWPMRAKAMCSDRSRWNTPAISQGR